MTSVVQVLPVLIALTRVLANMDHAVVAAVVPVTVTSSSSGLGNRVGRTELASRRTIIVVLPDPTVVVVSGFAIHKVVVGIARVGINGVSSFKNYYWLSMGNNNGYRGLFRAKETITESGIAIVATRGFAVLTFVGISVIMARVIVQITLVTRHGAGMTVVPIGGASYQNISFILGGYDVTLDRARGTRLVPVSIAVSISV